jgi:alpha-tubulin suppressor-like RCC1 family protein
MSSKPRSFYTLILLVLVLQFSVFAQSAVIRHIGGTDFVFIAKADGSVSGFGSEEHDGGLRSGGRGIATPQPLVFPGKVKQIESGSDMHFALLEDGTVYAWGMNDRGQFGRGFGSSRTADNPLRSAMPIIVPLPTDIVQIDAADHYGIALRSNGVVMIWGEHPGAEGLSDVTLATVKDLPPISTVSAGGRHVLALTKDGKVYGWGNNKNGQIGVEPTDQLRRIRKPTLVSGLQNVVSIAAQGSTNFGFSGAVKADGTVWMWGSNQSATMGTPLFWGNNGPPGTVNASPTKVAGITTARSIVSGNGHVAVLLADKTLRMWGHDGWGQIGIGTSGFYHPSPKKPAITNVAAVYAIANRTFAVKTDGTIWWWGVAPSRVGGPYGRDGKVPVQIAQF